MTEQRNDQFFKFGFRIAVIRSEPNGQDISPPWLASVESAPLDCPIRSKYVICIPLC